MENGKTLIKTLLVITTILLTLPASVLAITPYEVAKVIASDGNAGDWLGMSVSIDGHTAVVGAPSNDNNNGIDAGAAYIYVRSGTTWIQQAKLVASDGYSSDLFGLSVSISGDTVAIGARVSGSSGDRIGPAYIFTRSNATWTQQAKLTGSGGATNEYSSVSVSISGDTVAIGSIQSNNNVGIHSGAAFIFIRSGTSWTQQAKLVSSDGATGDYFGNSISIDGDTVAIGAYKGNNSAVDTGAAYIYMRSGTTWIQQAKLVASDGDSGDWFGKTISISGETVVVGSLGDDDIGPNSGAAYIYSHSGTSWAQQAKLKNLNGIYGDGFGLSVAMSSDIVVIGGTTSGTGIRTGAAFIYKQEGSIWTEKAELISSEVLGVSRFGSSVSVNNDTVLIGSLYGDNNGTSSGAAYLFILDTDTDGDGTVDHADNCPSDFNIDQADNDGDGDGDVCDLDDDNDNVDDDSDNCPLTVNTAQEDIDSDGLGDICDPDNDNDGIYDEIDTCPYTPEDSYVDNTGCQGSLYQDGYDAGYAIGYIDGYNAASPPPTEEITICHKLGTKQQKTMVLSLEESVKHLNHGDSVGECPQYYSHQTKISAPLRANTP